MTHVCPLWEYTGNTAIPSTSPPGTTGATTGSSPACYKVCVSAFSPPDLTKMGVGYAYSDKYNLSNDRRGTRNSIF